MSYAAATAKAVSPVWSDPAPVKHRDVGPPTIARHIVFYCRDALSDDMARTLEETPPAARLGLAESWLDAGNGDHDLTQTDIASDLAFAIRARDKRYELLAWCIMPTHVHVLIAQDPSTDLLEIVGRWMRNGDPSGPPKSPRDAIAWSPTFLAVAGSGDAWIAATKRHIDGNPVAAGLTATPECWHWSSASRSLSPARSRPPAGPGETAPRVSPRRDPPRRAAHVIFWLDDALSWSARRNLTRRPPGQRLYILDKALDEGRGRRSLVGRGAAATVQREILAADGERYGLIAWCVMPTHVHVLMSEMEDWPVAEIVGLWKFGTVAAASARRLFKTSASPWAQAYSNTAITGDTEIEDVKSYIEYNPVIAGLARFPQAWAWSSAIDPRGKAGRP